MKKRKFPQDISRFFNPQKSGSNVVYNSNGGILRYGTHQEEKAKERSCIPVYNAGGTARKVLDSNGKVAYK